MPHFDDLFWRGRFFCGGSSVYFGHVRDGLKITMYDITPVIGGGGVRVLLREFF